MAKDRLSDKLAVILHADVAGSTQLVQQDEHLAHERIQDSFRRFGDTITKYQGHVRELRGDALLAEFERASDAVTATLAFQADNAYHNSRIKDDIRPMVRVGIAMGEVIIADGTITGAGVVLAQRVEQLADSGGLCITAALHESLPRRMPFDLEDLGEQELKGFDDPVHVYRVELSVGETIPPPQHTSRRETSLNPRSLMVATGLVVLLAVGGFTYWAKNSVPQEEPASLDRMVLELPDKPSIAVLPFANMSNDPDQEYFVDGMTEDLITDLSKIPELFVISRNSTFTYKGRAVKVRVVAEELGVRYVLEGSVRRVGSEVRINAQLIDALSGGHVWAERYDGSLADIFALQDNVTDQIVTALALNLTGERASKKTTARTQAYDLFLQGWAHYQRHTADDFAQAVPLFEASIQLDSEYAQAHAALAAVYWETWDNRWAKALNISLPNAMNNAKEHLEEAMKEPSSLAHWVASNLLIAEKNYKSAIKEARKVITLDSNNADGYAVLAKALTLSGKTDEGAKLIETAVRLDPHYSPLHSATQRGDSYAVRHLIADGNNVDARDYLGKTPLHVVAENGHAEIAALLIEAGADIEARTKLINNLFVLATPLMIAAHWGNTTVAELLISAGADVNARDKTSAGPWTVLHFAAETGHTGVAELLITNGADVNASSGTRRLSTPLIVAAREGHEAFAELLISKGASVNEANNEGSTPLHFAARSGEFDSVQLLLAKGADVNARTLSGYYPGETTLHAAAYAGHMRIAELLLANGADINAASQTGYTPLYRSIELGDQAMAELLIKEGADTATRSVNGATLLHVVATTGHVAIAELLITGGADVNAKDSSGFTPLDHAQGGVAKMIETFQRHSALCTIC